MEGKANNMFVVPKSAQGLNIRFKTTELSFAGKSPPSGCLVSHFTKGGFIALYQHFGRGGGHTDRVINPTCPPKTAFLPICNFLSACINQNGVICPTAAAFHWFATVSVADVLPFLAYSSPS